MTPPHYAWTYDSIINQWRTEELRGLTAEDWHQWIVERVSGRDKWFGYGQDEFPDLTARLFASVAQFCRSGGVDLAPARDGAARALAETHVPEAGEAIALNVMLAARNLTDYEFDDGAATVAQWVESGGLIEAGGIHLQRRGLFSLAVLQELHGGRFADIWQHYFAKDDELENPYFYVGASFVGLVASAKGCSDAAVAKLAHLADAAKNEGYQLAARSAMIWYTEVTLRGDR